MTLPSAGQEELTAGNVTQLTSIHLHESLKHTLTKEARPERLCSASPFM